MTKYPIKQIDVKTQEEASKIINAYLDSIREKFEKTEKDLIDNACVCRVFEDGKITHFRTPDYLWLAQQIGQLYVRTLLIEVEIGFEVDEESGKKSLAETWKTFKLLQKQVLQTFDPKEKIGTQPVTDCDQLDNKDG